MKLLRTTDYVLSDKIQLMLNISDTNLMVAANLINRHAHLMKQTPIKSMFIGDTALFKNWILDEEEGSCIVDIDDKNEINYDNSLSLDDDDNIEQFDTIEELLGEIDLYLTEYGKTEFTKI